MYKLRRIVYSKKGSRYIDIKGLTVPQEIAVFFEGVYFSAEKSGNSIIFTSGCNDAPTPEEVKKYNFEDVRI